MRIVHHLYNLIIINIPDQSKLLMKYLYAARIKTWITDLKTQSVVTSRHWSDRNKTFNLIDLNLFISNTLPTFFVHSFQLIPKFNLLEYSINHIKNNLTFFLTSKYKSIQNFHIIIIALFSLLLYFIYFCWKNWLQLSSCSVICIHCHFSAIWKQH